MIENKLLLIGIEERGYRFRAIICWIILITIVLKDGIDIYGNAHVAESANLFPYPYDGTSGELINSIIYHYLHLNNFKWTLLMFALQILVLLAIGMWSIQNGGSTGVKTVAPFIFLMNSPIVLVLFQEVGHHQTLFVLFALIFSIQVGEKKHIDS